MKMNELIFVCDEVGLTHKEYWDELIEIAFVEDSGDIALVIVRLAYEDEIEIMDGDQGHYTIAHHKNVNLTLDDKILRVKISKPIEKYENAPHDFKIKLNHVNTDLSDALVAIKKPRVLT
jgi:hypothetical protein